MNKLSKQTVMTKRKRKLAVATNGQTESKLETAGRN
ncbi:hypothetical protein Desal_0781 [Maridesulfovibrio salexigens DSM 2638]|uniref:Uncharacterized protein n=1 Tax=Maridesulfovibrio salexigens (strain ATCC 14822 / DSM 2638 / NCIMB 8403 / VKM B-1763) TaxID=526222 RepID=C6BZ23_MARSD|nr:hypothetical protein Desal_0781 [Maridesulfovibrio salexigens DSM 2638]